MLLCAAGTSAQVVVTLKILITKRNSNAGFYVKGPCHAAIDAELCFGINMSVQIMGNVLLVVPLSCLVVMSVKSSVIVRTSVMRALIIVKLVRSFLYWIRCQLIRYSIQRCRNWRVPPVLALVYMEQQIQQNAK